MTLLFPSCSAVHESRVNMQKRLDIRTRSVEDMLEAMGGRLAMETHVSSQKANWKFQGVKEAFMGELSRLRGVRELLERDLASESSTTVKDVKALKAKIRALNASICQVEQELMSGVQQLARLHENAAKLATKAAAQLPHIESDLRDYMSGHPEPLEPALEGMDEPELLQLLAEEEARAAWLEQQGASSTATWAAEETRYTTLQGAICAALNEIRDLEEECNVMAKKYYEQHEDRLQKFHALAATISRLTGVEVLEQEPNLLRVIMTQTIPRGMDLRENSLRTGSTSPSAAAKVQDSTCDAVVAEHVLVIESEGPGSAQLCTATLDPAVVEIDELVQAARDAQAAGGFFAIYPLSVLVLDVKARIRKHCRRQLLLGDANNLYPLQPTSVSPELLRCALPNKVEVEILVPMAWPEEPGARLQLVEMQAPRISQDSAPLLARLQQELKNACSSPGRADAVARRHQLQNCSLRELLDWVYGRLVTEQSLGLQTA
ncbi:hypothetical protein Vretimale_16550 [Volvox reticuliferus]|uniref:Uncharacterized protein n=1 Tax=Volvox reticuliferus TaxID=1737510 RepID=A0A8J4CD55_9CHLO|nr:hypothetical protein Vretifemale_8740 [Volvox reticuliferus]GIM13411.1 hypothetical protein Vretimale_16550 [Volvox reticuliferus]